jgi:hypothetical protein
MQPLELSLIGNLERIMQDCHDRLSRDYRQPQRVNGEIQMPRDEDGAAYPPPTVSNSMGETGRPLNSYPQHSEFRNTEFQPPLTHAPQTTLAASERNGSLDNLPAPEASNEVLFSTFQYASEKSQSCGCIGPCHCLDEAMGRNVQWNDLNSNQPWSQMNARNDDFDWWPDLEKGL